MPETYIIFIYTILQENKYNIHYKYKWTDTYGSNLPIEHETNACPNLWGQNEKCMKVHLKLRQHWHITHDEDWIDPVISSTISAMWLIVHAHECDPPENCLHFPQRRRKLFEREPTTTKLAHHKIQYIEQMLPTATGRANVRAAGQTDTKRRTAMHGQRFICWAQSPHTMSLFLEHFSMPFSTEQSDVCLLYI